MDNPVEAVDPWQTWGPRLMAVRNLTALSSREEVEVPQGQFERSNLTNHNIQMPTQVAAAVVAETGRY